jgi:hypothetical protein
MTPDAESQGLAQGFNDKLIAPGHTATKSDRPRPRSEARSVDEEIAAERAAYDERHSTTALLERRPDQTDARFEDAPPPANADPWANVTKRQIADALKQHGAADSDVIVAYEKNDKAVSKPQLVEAAEAAGLRPE